MVDQVMCQGGEEFLSACSNVPFGGGTCLAPELQCVPDCSSSDSCSGKLHVLDFAEYLCKKIDS